MMQPVWQQRTGAGLADDFATFSDSTKEDAHFILHDLAGSSAHVKGLEHAGLLTSDEAQALLTGLKGLAAAWTEATWTLDPALEDVHMNIEGALSDSLGDVAKKLHTGRSRNDQVATCITLYAREQLAALAQAAAGVARQLSAQAEAHQATPWVAKTHGQPAQPATLGFLLAAHAFRFQTVAKRALHAFHAIDESPLGSGAIAGSTLPLDPDFTADLLGLQPPRNALLATGARDTILTTLSATTDVGQAAQSLAQDLLDLFADKALVLPAGYTSGSSLMPHKRNPDALELVRGQGKSLVGVQIQAVSITSGIGLGYQRDLQLTKPLLVQGLSAALSCCQILSSCLNGARFDPHVLAGLLDAPGITATDAVEALVDAGLPFRDAYGALAAYHAALEDGAGPDGALAATGLDSGLQDLLVGALAPRPLARTTTGGPGDVPGQLVRLAACDATLAIQIESAISGAATPFLLLEDA